MTAATHKFQAPKGTRDFFPPDMAVRRYLDEVWRSVSIRHGFDEIDGPTFEHLELYTIKSGPAIVSELFSFQRAGGQASYALRPEFTPTLARMVAARAAQLPRPIKWFGIPSMYRAERPQRGRLREHRQWNVDLLGMEGPEAEAEIISVAVAALERFGLSPRDVRIRLSHRSVLARILQDIGIGDDRLDDAFTLLDRREKLPPEEFVRQAGSRGYDADQIERLQHLGGTRVALSEGWSAARGALGLPDGDSTSELETLAAALGEQGSIPWCDLDLGIVRGLAYYTGSVFEVHETRGRERAIAGGGRYDRLVELFGGPSMPAVGFAMGDVVIRLVLEDRGLLEPGEHYLPRPDVVVINARDEAPSVNLLPLVADLRGSGLHTRHSYRDTRNVGKLLGEACRQRARLAVILGAELEDGQVAVKDLDSGEQIPVPRESLLGTLRSRLGETIDRGGS